MQFGFNLVFHPLTTLNLLYHLQTHTLLCINNRYIDRIRKPIRASGVRHRDVRKHTRLRRRGASMSMVQRLSVTDMDPSSFLVSLTTSLSTKTGIRGHFGNRLT